MTDETLAMGTVTVEASVSGAGGDPILRLFASIAEHASFEVGITVAVDGALVSGVLVGQDEWLRLLGQTMDGGDSIAQSLRRYLNKGLHEAVTAVIEPLTDDPQPEEYEYLHLKNARYVMGEAFVPTPAADPVLWRGRIVHISGWSWGALTAPGAH
ncbi:gas vesicle accessory protein GvpU [Kineosporia sp. NBRC 101731]|uniref:gas vesicle accessory protein GvpU n=1 Tax=Kineosporia sp. NBRC 101731 TaxID=3032199 RepID=UPI0024A35939|nr:gas vesicle accessory protein GvpU [Kineosporia sp. NBRC 101731]GLY27389.1 hypothetical protein Kisp02_07540 [Kineosporia sp. NBRC 101731]